MPDRNTSAVLGRWVLGLRILVELGVYDDGDRSTMSASSSSVRDWCGETGQPREVAAAALAHVVKNPVAAAYARSDPCSSGDRNSWRCGLGSSQVRDSGYETPVSDGRSAHGRLRHPFLRALVQS